MNRGDSAPFFRVADLPSKEVLPGVVLRSVSLENLMMTFVEYASGTSIPVHRHRREQITCVLEGSIEVTVGGERRVLGAGEGILIPPNRDHSSRPVGGAARALDAWTPVPERFRVDIDTTLGGSTPVEGESPR